MLDYEPFIFPTLKSIPASFIYVFKISTFFFCFVKVR